MSSSQSGDNDIEEGNHTDEAEERAASSEVVSSVNESTSPVVATDGIPPSAESASSAQVGIEQDDGDSEPPRRVEMIAAAMEAAEEDRAASKKQQQQQQQTSSWMGSNLQQKRSMIEVLWGRVGFASSGAIGDVDNGATIASMDDEIVSPSTPSNTDEEEEEQVPSMPVTEVDSTNGTIPAPREEEDEPRATRITEAYLVEDDRDASFALSAQVSFRLSDEVVVATHLEQPLPWWKHKRAKLLFSLLLILGVFCVIAMGLAIAFANNETDTSDMTSSGERQDNVEIPSTKEEPTLIAYVGNQQPASHQNLDLSKHGYPYVQDTSTQDTAEGWVAYPPDAYGPSVQFGASDGITSLEECATKCQDVKAPTGAWSDKYMNCWCNFIEEAYLCLEPCVEDQYVDFSIVPFSQLGYCEKSVCNESWFYNEQYCDVDVGFDRVKCDEKIETLATPPSSSTEENFSEESEQEASEEQPEEEESKEEGSSEEDSFSGAYCILVKTGLGKDWYSGGLEILIDSGYGYENVALTGTTPEHIYDEEEVVLDQCFSTLISVLVHNPTTDGWYGSAYFSIDQKKSYSPFICNDCDVRVGLTDPIQVDGDEISNDDTSASRCGNGAFCTLTMVSLCTSCL